MSGLEHRGDLIGLAELRTAIADNAHHFDDHTFRQDHPGSAHCDTETLYLRMPPWITEVGMFEDLSCVDWPLMSVTHFRRAVREIAILACAAPARAMIVRLRAGGRIKPHIDQGTYAERTDRYHFAITSNPDCVMQVGTTCVSAAPGEVWFFDKHLPHAVFNLGDAARDHLIVDVWK